MTYKRAGAAVPGEVVHVVHVVGDHGDEPAHDARERVQSEIAHSERGRVERRECHTLVRRDTVTGIRVSGKRNVANLHDRIWVGLRKSRSLQIIR